ncbi:flagellar hook protein FlgE [Agrobacterium larrymoorei]|uniref:Flagellar hook protein FlgE n=1 Tax=Agrobacterium larrymoorei TaxID=160699 RepID=A0AAF0HAH1_9HYPH|nr:flagellar hook protein FlgE [Agrobacterium larrymoorei]WHA40820.1 flagellar hook protein FlgE [Agrobacterium larrymoorei]
MSLFGTMKTAVSGMGAQANKLGTVGDNIANASTTGYKSASTAFSTLVLSSSGGNYNSGGVSTSVNYSISQQGALQATQSSTDLAISGDGFFVVQDTAGNVFLTRAGSFTADSDGNLVNDSGYTLLGYEYTGATPTTVINSYDGLVPVNVSANGMTATPSTSGKLTGNLSDSAPILDPTVDLGDNTATIAADQKSILKTSATGYDALGNAIQYDFYFAKNGDGTWDVAVYNAAYASSGGFPYSEGPITTDTMNYDFDAKEFDVTELVIEDTENDVSITMDVSGMTQYAATTSTVSEGSINGNPAEEVQSITISSDGTVYATYAKSTARALFQIPLADVASPDKLTVLSGNVFQTSPDSGVVTLGFAGQTGFGSINSKQLESSNVDIATELTEMIQAQRSYTANSKVFQTGSDLMETLINLVR